MATLNTVFKKVYEEALAPYGFKKIKGRQPYFVRMIKDEIIHVVTVVSEPTIYPEQKEYGIYGGVATVYRPCINFDKSPKDNKWWFVSDMVMYRDLHILEGEKYGDICEHEFSYLKNNEESLMESMRNSVKATNTNLIKKLNEVVNIRACMDFFNDFSLGVLGVSDDEELGKRYESNEGLINFIVFHDFDEYMEYRNLRDEIYEKVWLHLIKSGKTKMTVESFYQMQADGEKNRQRVNGIIKEYMDNSEKHERIMKELESRRKQNIERLKFYGIEKSVNIMV